MKKLITFLILLSMLSVSSCNGGMGGASSSVVTSGEALTSVISVVDNQSEALISSQNSSAVSGQDTLSKIESNSTYVSGEIADTSSNNLTSDVNLTDRGIDPTKPMVCLTFDDGPSKRGTVSILDTLEKYGVVATFFDVGKNVEVHPEIVQRELALGCEVASHSYSHTDLNKLSPDALKKELDNANKAFEAAIGYSPVLIRPPYGNCSSDVAKQINQAVITWSVDTLDWSSKNPEKIFEAVKKEGNLDRKCVLMHSIYEETADALELIIPYLLKEGYQLVTVSEMIVYGNGDEIVSGKRYGYSYFR